MANVRFLELYRCAGVYEGAAAMVVPRDGSNMVVLEEMPDCMLADIGISRSQICRSRAHVHPTYTA